MILTLLQQMDLLLTERDEKAKDWSTNKNHLIKLQDGLLNSTSGTNSTFADVGPTQKQPQVDDGTLNLTPDNRVDISFLMNRVDRTLAHRYFLCRIITPPVQLTYYLLTIVDDPEGERAVRLAVHNYSCKYEALLQVLPIGAILVVQNPWFKAKQDDGYILRVDNPADLVILNEMSVQRLFSNLLWKNEVPEKYPPLLTKPKPKQTPKLALKWKDMGNKLFVNQLYSKAVECYTEGLLVDPDNIEILSNRAAAYIGQEYFYRALEDTEKLLILDPNHLKGNYRKAKSLWGLKQYDKALEFLQNFTTSNCDLANIDGLLELLSKYRTLEKVRRSGEYDWKTLFEGKLKHHLDFVDYVGPVISKDIPGKGRGLITTEDILPGKLLIANKALSIYYHCLLNGDMNGRLGLVEKVVNKLTAEPEYEKEVYKLCHTPRCRRTKKIDPSRIADICTLNAFGGNVGGGSESEANYGGINKTGLWLLPSYINHSCGDSNCTWTTLGDVILIRSFKNISKGEEILISYVNPLEQFDERILGLKNYNFTCNCTLCQLDMKDKKHVRIARQKILDAIDLHPGNNDWLRRQILEIERLRSSHPSLNTAIVIPLYRMAQVYFAASQIKNCTEALIQAYNIVKTTPLIRQPAEFALNIISAFVTSDETDQVKKWLKIFKQDLLIRYGSLEVLNSVARDYITLLQEYGINTI